MTISLNGQWTLTCLPPEGDARLQPFTIPATVPGNVELDLYNAGREPEPFFGENEYRYFKYEVCAWRFEKSLAIPEIPSGEKVRLIFEGLNCVADVFVNEKRVYHAENALIPHQIDVTDALLPGKENFFRVEIASAVLEARKKDFPVHIGANEGSDEFTVLRMPPHSFGWDIMPRFV